MSKVKSISKVQHESLAEGFYDLLGSSKEDYSKVVLSDTVNTLTQLALVYISKINTKIEERDVASSGKMSDEIQPTEVAIEGHTYTVGVYAPDYASYQDEGVSGWAQDRGSRFKFKTKGVDPKSAMVKSIKAWLDREGKSASIVTRYTTKNGEVKTGISAREKRGKQIDEQTKNAITTAYMIKRQGIAPTHFWRDATEEMAVYVKNEFGAALKIDIINNLLR